MSSAPQDMCAHQRLPPLHFSTFEGPLDLLLELVRKREVDIFDIPIADITEEYLSVMESMRSLDLELGGEWVETAAWLVLIKSRMLLPKPVEEDEDGPDPREELIQRLLEYERYKYAARQLNERPVLDRDVFTHPSKANKFLPMLGPPPLAGATVVDLVSALRRIVARSKNRGEWVIETSTERLNLRAVIAEIAEVLADRPRIQFDDLFEGRPLDRHRIVTTFLALLEMTRLHMVSLMQNRLDDGHIYIQRTVVDIVEISQQLDFSSESEER
jgi:segregation and condensation protein A